MPNNASVVSVNVHLLYCARSLYALPNWDCWLAIVSPKSWNDVMCSTMQSLITINGGGLYQIEPNSISLVFFVLMFIRIWFDQLTFDMPPPPASDDWWASNNFRVLHHPRIWRYRALCACHLSASRICMGQTMFLAAFRHWEWSIETILTRCWRFDRNECIQRILNESALSAAIFDSTVERSTWSNVLP